ncbi:MAG: A24 family peptidase [Anaerolineae bacterium]|jgi:leader peptidase (prepilin peptidase)/N-methyltransferase
MIALYALLGLAVGVAINLLADQLPRWRRVRRAPFCTHKKCDAPRPYRAWSGLLAYASRQTRCSQCGTRLPWRHLLTEVGTAALFAFLWHRYGTTQEWVFLVPYTVYSAIFVLVIVIDMEHKLILNVVMFPAWVLAFLGSFLHPRPYFWRLSLLGGVVGYGLLFLVFVMGELFVKVMDRIRGKPINTAAFGFGDVRLGGFIGLVLGFPQVLTAIFYGILLGGLGGLIYWFVQAVIRRNYSLFTPIPYGPYLAIGAMVVMFFVPF